MSPDGRLLDRVHQRVHAVGIFPLIIGRAPESGIVVADDDVSSEVFEFQLPDEPAGPATETIVPVAVPSLPATRAHGYWAGQALTGSLVVSAFAAALSESVGFYAVLLLRDMVRDAYPAGARRVRYGQREIARTWRNVFIELGPSELLDATVLRPLCMGLGGRFLGLQLGVIAGKIVADVAFYMAPILTTEARRRRSERADG